MPNLQRILFNVLSADLQASADFYRWLVGFETLYETDWYVVLTPPGQPMVQLGLIDQVSEFTPRHAWGSHNGAFLTLVVDDVLATVEKARMLGAEVVEDPVALASGQTRALIRDRDGTIVDLSTPTELLVSRDEEEVVPEQRMRAIDQDQPEDYGRR